MLTTIAKLFGKSPFSPLQNHMKKVSLCIKKLTQMFESLEDRKNLEDLNKNLCKLEYEADLTKNDIRNNFPKSLFLPIDRTHFLEILTIQDKIADKAEDIGNLLILQSLDKDLYENLFVLYKKNSEAFSYARNIIKEIDCLLESSFGGIEAQKVKGMVEKTSFSEYEATKLKNNFMKDLFQNKNSFSISVFYLYTRLIEEINHISDISEKLANRIRMILELR